MLQQSPLCIAVKLSLMKALRVMKLTSTAKDVLSFFIDEVASRSWSTDRLALAVRKHPRTVDRALAELRAAGFITVLYRRRRTSVKVLCVGAILEAVKHGVEVAKQKASAAISLLRKGFQASARVSANVHLGRLKDDTGGFWRVQAAPSASLLASLGMRTGPRRL